MSTQNAAVLACILAVVTLLSVTPAGGQTPPAQAPPKPAGEVRQVKVLADKAPDCSTLKSVVDSVTRGCQGNDEKAIAVYNFMQLAHYHLAYPGEPGGVPALKLINVYGWSLCGGLHSCQSALWRQLGWEWRFVGWPGHTTVEAKYDGQWHYLDVFLRFYCWRPDPNSPSGRSIAAQDDIKANPALVSENLVLDTSRKVYYQKDNRFEVIDDKANWLAPAFLVCGDEAAGVISGVSHQSRAGSPAEWAGIKHEGDYSTDVNLGPGYSLTLTWDPIEGAHWFNGRQTVPKHSCGGGKDFRNSPDIGPILEPYFSVNNGQRSYANGQLVFAPDFSGDAFLSALAGRENVKLDKGQLVPAEAGKPASITVRLQSPYVMSRAGGQAEGADSSEISLDGGKTFKAIDLKDFSDPMGGRYDCLVKVSFKEALKSLRLEAIVQCNRCVLPYLSPGRNKIAVSAADPAELGGNKLVVTYAYRLGSRNRSYEEMAEREAEVAKAHYAAWSETPTLVQKTFTAKDLPGTFQIDCPTPKDKYPVYPRMLFVRREVLPAAGKPVAVPANAAEMKVAPGEELKALPNPFLVGTAKPPPKPVRPTTTRQVALVAAGAASMDGQAARNHFLKWKDNETWIMLVGGQLKDLPAVKDIAAARLVFPVVRGHKDAATKVAAVLLKAPPEAGKAYDFANLGDVAGSVAVPKQPDNADYNPPKEFKIDVTRTLKQIAAGDAKFNGLAIRTVPDRPTDEGYIVRIDMPDSPKVYLEIDVYAGPATPPKPEGK